MRSHSADTHPGLTREHNEDCYLADPALGLWLVADGIGGHECGEIASDIVRSTIAAAVREGLDLQLAVERAHSAVLEEIDARPDATNMGSTVVALKLDGSAYEIIWVGDSRAYLWDTSLVPLTSDHSYVAALLAEGVITEAQAANHPERHIITHSLGVSRDMEMHTGRVEGILQAHQQLVLCSDGLTDELSDAAIASEMKRNDSPQAQVGALMKAALDSGGRDNVTLVVVGPDSAAGESPADMDITQDFEGGKTAPDGSNKIRKAWLAGALIVGVIALAWWMV